MSSAASSDKCITANPDIAGIGVRIAIYVQGILSVVTLFAYMADGVITRQERKSAVWQAFTLTVTVCAMLISTVVQAVQSDLDPYHGLIVLNLCWISCLGLSLLPLFVRWNNRGTSNVPVLKQVWAEVIQLDPRRPSRKAWVNWSPYVVVGAFGVWIWGDVLDLRLGPECYHDLRATVIQSQAECECSFVGHPAEADYVWLGRSAERCSPNIFVDSVQRLRHSRPRAVFPELAARHDQRPCFTNAITYGLGRKLQLLRAL